MFRKGPRRRAVRERVIIGRGGDSSGKPVLLRVDYDAGHGPGSMRSQIEDEIVDVLSFALWQTGNPDFQPPASK